MCNLPRTRQQPNQKTIDSQYRSTRPRPRLVCYPLSMEFQVEEQDGEIIVTDGVFTAVYHKPDKLDPQLKLKSRTPTDDHALLARAWIAAVSMARELGWIV